MTVRFTMEAPRSVLLTGNAARRRTHVQWVLANFALATWVSRHLTGDEALSLALWRLSFGPGYNRYRGSSEEVRRQASGSDGRGGSRVGMAAARFFSPRVGGGEGLLEQPDRVVQHRGQIHVSHRRAEVGCRGPSCHRSSSAPSRSRRCERKGSPAQHGPPCASGICPCGGRRVVPLPPRSARLVARR